MRTKRIVIVAGVLVNDSHWSFVDYLHVMPDGTIISSGGNVLN